LVELKGHAGCTFDSPRSTHCLSALSRRRDLPNQPASLLKRRNRYQPSTAEIRHKEQVECTFSFIELNLCFMLGRPGFRSRGALLLTLSCTSVSFVLDSTLDAHKMYAAGQPPCTHDNQHLQPGADASIQHNCSKQVIIHAHKINRKSPFESERKQMSFENMSFQNTNKRTLRQGQNLFQHSSLCR
jgi:hypothetical protein